MSELVKPDWDPGSDEVVRDPRSAYDQLRTHCPVAYSRQLGWSLFRHEDVRRVLLDHETFSSAVSAHPSVPNGMDPPLHTVYRRIIEPYFSPARMAAFEPVCREVAATLVDAAATHGHIELMADLARPFAVRVQCTFLGWPATLHEPLIHWIDANRQATAAQDRPALALLARAFEGFIDEMLQARIQRGAGPDDDITASLMHETVDGRVLTHDEIASILRNWTAGEIGTIAAAVAIVGEFLATHPDVQAQLRAQPALLPDAIDEILRIHGPLVANRRVTLRPVTIDGRAIGVGERLSLNWIAANRDGAVFKDPDTFSLDRDPDKNLLYGLGVHVCPGAPLARMELQIVIDEWLRRTASVEPARGQSPVHATYPASGFSAVPLRIQPAAQPA